MGKKGRDRRKHLGDVRIGPTHVAVYEETDPRGDDGEQLYGQYRALDNELRVRAGLERGKWETVLMHEALHAIDDIYGLKLSENQTHRIATGVTMFIRDNPGWLGKE